MTTTEASGKPIIIHDLAEERSKIGAIVRALGAIKEDERETNARLAKVFAVKGGVSKVQEALRGRIRQFLELEDESELSYEGWVATLGKPPESLWLDETDQQLTDDVIAWAFRQGLLTLNVSAWRAAEKRSTAEMDALRHAVHTSEGTPKVTVEKVR